MRAEDTTAMIPDSRERPDVATRPLKRFPQGTNLDQAAHNKIVSFLWGIADDVLRDLFKRGKYPDVILPMCVLRRLDAVLEPTKKAMPFTCPRAMLRKSLAGIAHAQMSCAGFASCSITASLSRSAPPTTASTVTARHLITV
jgi:hypothetical protein